jgi:signal peptidase II
MRRVRAYLVFHAILLVVLLGDQLTKLLADKYLIGKSIAIIPGCIFLSHAQNSGAIWSLFRGNGLLLGVIGILVLVMIFVSRKHLELKRRVNQVVYGMICAGIAGNIIDRLLYGHVIDFIDIRLGSYSWPMFNVADSAICLGIFAYFLFTFFQKKKRETKATFY